MLMLHKLIDASSVWRFGRTDMKPFRLRLISAIVPLESVHGSSSTARSSARKEKAIDLFNLHRVLPRGEVRRLLLLLLGHSAGILLAQSATDGAGLLWSEVEGEILLLCVEDSELVALVGVDDGERTCDRFAQVVSICKKLLVFHPPRYNDVFVPRVALLSFCCFGT